MYRLPTHPLLAGLAVTTFAGALLGTTLPRQLPEEDPLTRPLEQALERAQAQLEAQVQVYTDHSTLADPWVVRTDHYEVRSTSSFRQTEDVARALEQMLPHYQRVLDTDWLPSEPLPVTLVPDLETYRARGVDFGDARSSYYSAFLASEGAERTVYSMQAATETGTLVWVTHAAAQQYVDRAFARRLPAWIEQGIGAYFSMYWAWPWAEEQLARLIEEGGYLPISEVIGASIDDYVENSEARVIELAMLFTYLLDVRPERAAGGDADPPEPRFVDYLHHALRGRPLQRHPFQEWLTQNADAIERDFRATYAH